MDHISHYLQIINANFFWPSKKEKKQKKKKEKKGSWKVVNKFAELVLKKRGYETNFVNLIC